MARGKVLNLWASLYLLTIKSISQLDLAKKQVSNIMCSQSLKAVRKSKFKFNKNPYQNL